MRHEVVHNKFVVEDLKAKGAVFIEAMNEVPRGATLIYSAHGVPLSVRKEAEDRGLRVFDATCPLVTKVRVADPEKLAYVTQTTLSVDDAARMVEALKARFPHIRGPKKDDICYATQNRQDAVKKLAAECDLVIVVGSPNSSNSNRLREVARNMGLDAYMVDNAGQLQEAWFAGKSRIGVTAGASAPEVLVEGVVARLRELGASAVVPLAGIEENVNFPLPRALVD